MKQEIEDILYTKIIEKPKLKGLTKEYITKKIDKFFQLNPKELKILEYDFQNPNFNFRKNKNFKMIIKGIRKEIGIVYEIFLTTNFTKKDKILNKITNIKESIKILELHKSTRERKDDYKKIYSKIFSKIKPKQITDLGCGLNPISYQILEGIITSKPNYISIDLNQKDMDFLNKYFKKFDIKGKAKQYDLTNLDFLNDRDIINSDTIFIFMLLDSLESIKRNISLDIIDNLKDKYLIISFPMKSIISKKEIKTNKRNWIRKYLKKKQLKYEEFQTSNELFFLIYPKKLI